MEIEKVQRNELSNLAIMRAKRPAGRERIKSDKANTLKSKKTKGKITYEANLRVKDLISHKVYTNYRFSAILDSISRVVLYIGLAIALIGLAISEIIKALRG